MKEDAGPLPSFLAEGGEMGARMRAKDWAKTPLGRPETWPQSLKIAVRIVLTSRYAMWMAWGPELTFFCNDAYKPTLGVKEAWALGSPSTKVWQEIWPEIGPRIEKVMQTGTATWDEELLLFLERSGYPEETYHTFSYSPVPGDAGDVAGMLCVVTEETPRVIGERRLASLRGLAADLSTTNSEEEALAAFGRQVGLNQRDLPFTLLYLLDEDGKLARLAAATGMPAHHAAAAPALPLDGSSSWPIEIVLRDGDPVTVANLAARFGRLPQGAWDKPPRDAIVVPVASQGQANPAGFLITGINPYRPYDVAYAGFVDLVAGQIAASLANARAYEKERRRAEALAEIDRAKTQFFSNVSHEFRTPLTLMMGPLEDVLNDAAPDALDRRQREQLDVAHRNSLRLLRLVNSLLDFSRIEAGRAQASYRPVDLASFTTELAAGFRSATDKAGLALTLNCEALPEPVYVDQEMWEKIVLNLISNAFKFTFEGGITVELRRSANGTAAELTVRDTGTGIAEHELPRLFERFHRVENAKGRTFEGSGIGLALVQELVRLHGGAIRVESELGRGSTFMVSLPLGTAHLARDRIQEAPAEISAGARTEAYVQEALRWLPGEGPLDDRPLATAAAEDLGDDAADGRGQRVLLADDNADMRDYVHRLLSARGYEVEAVGDGEAALEAARRQRPDLVLTDVMMPRLDGFALLRAWRSDSALRDVPVILLSARAGEEANVEGLDAGADDYLVKPFSARELLARVRASLNLARERRRAQEALLQLNESLEHRVAERTAELHENQARLRSIFETSYQYQGLMALDGTLLDANATSLEGIGAKLEDVVGKPFWDSPWFSGTPGMPEEVRNAAALAAKGETVQQEILVHLPVGGWRWFDFTMRPLRDSRGAIVALVPEAVEVTLRREAEERLRQSQKMEAVGQLTGGVAHDFNNLLQVVSGNLQLLARDIAGNERAQRRVANAQVAVTRGSKLASQLLAFGRRQPLEPKVVNIGRLVSGLDEMLRRSLGEAVEIETMVSGGLWNTLIDPTQIENAILNLAINARDAMDGNGKLTIEVGNAFLDDAYTRGHPDVSPGQYVMLAVTDTGCGMTPEVMAQVFEPFFSTKPEGKGTGLGLSMVYGFVKQSGGHVKVYSEVGQGTTIKLYLPRVDQREDLITAVDDAPVAAGTGTVLVAEDDPEVRATVVEMLGELGYRVLKARDAASALTIIESGMSIDLLFTDVVMPGTLTSPELARMARARLPNIAVLFTSGYTENAIVHGGRLDAGVELLSKPFSREDLARKVRHVLANQAQVNQSNAAKMPAPEPKPAQPVAAQKPSVLLVEDDFLIRMITAEMLDDLGYAVSEANNAEEAMAALQAAPVDILVVDLGLPGVSGATVAANARKLRPGIGVIFATGSDRAPEIGGAATLLRKPFDQAGIAAALQAVQKPAD